MTDEELFLAYVKGDERAFRTLYIRRKSQFLAWTVRRVGDRGLAEDIFQQAWITLIKSRHRYEPKAKFTTFAATIIDSRIKDHFRQTSRRPVGVHMEDETVPQLASDEPNPLELTMTAEDQRRFDICLGGLPEEQKNVLTLKSEWDMSWDEIAENIGAPVETARSRFRYAIAKMRACLQGGTK